MDTGGGGDGLVDEEGSVAVAAVDKERQARALGLAMVRNARDHRR